MLKIVKGKKIPPRTYAKTGGRGLKKYPFGDMKKGDAFFVPAAKRGGVETSLVCFNRNNKKKVKLVRREIGDKVWFWRA